MDGATKDLAGDDAALLGTPAEIIEKLKRLRAGGIEYVLLVGYGDINTALREFALEVMPHVQGNALTGAPIAEKKRTAMG